MTKTERRVYARAYYRKNREKICQQIKIRRQKSLAAFRQYGKKQQAKWRKKNVERAKFFNGRSYLRNRTSRLAKSCQLIRDRRERVLAHYGKICKCCGETLYEFLTIDHELGGGTQHRKVIGRGSAFYRWIEKHNYPAELRILCYNCNCAIGHYGYCPHQQVRAQQA